MSMDDQYREMKNFHRALVSFNEHLRDSFTDLQRQHENVSPHWQDQMRLQYDGAWYSLDNAMKYYLNAEGPEYIRFLEAKLRVFPGYMGE